MEFISYENSIVYIAECGIDKLSNLTWELDKESKTNNILAGMVATLFDKNVNEVLSDAAKYYKNGKL